MTLTKKNILLGITGGIAAYKTAELVRGLIKRKASVRVVMTKSAARFVSPLTLEILSGNRVHTSLWDGDPEEIDHVALSLEADLLLVAPATANTIAKIANGIADNLLTNLFLTFEGPVLIAPSMNSRMYRHPSVQANLETLRGRGVHVIEPEAGELACGEEGVGRLPDPGTIIDEAELLYKKKGELSGKKVLVTAGPTREFFDPVRFISNPSTGKMGYAIAEAAAKRGAEVLLISGPSSLPAPRSVQRLRVVTAEEMHGEVRTHLDAMDIAVMAAAVSDYRPKKRFPGKIKKGLSIISCDLQKTPDILEDAGKSKNGLFLVGFAAETEGLEKKMKEKMRRKKCALMVGNIVNSPQSGFESDENEVVIMGRKEPRMKKIPRMTKREVAEKIIDKIVEEMVS